jgi:hypothetical protein
MLTDRHGEANRRIFATFSCERARKPENERSKEESKEKREVRKKYRNKARQKEGKV